MTPHPHIILKTLKRESNSQLCLALAARNTPNILVITVYQHVENVTVER